MPIDTPRKLSFPKSHRLRGKLQFQLLFTSGQSLRSGNLLAQYRIMDKESNGLIQVAFGIPRKHFRKAVTRNHIRRRMREAWRIHHPPFEVLPGKGKLLHLIILWQGKEIGDTKSITQSMRKLLAALEQKICATPSR